jgi:hypothetical protein
VPADPNFVGKLVKRAAHNERLLDSWSNPRRTTLNRLVELHSSPLKLFLGVRLASSLANKRLVMLPFIY